jgi:hypothetical protein
MYAVHGIVIAQGGKGCWRLFYGEGTNQLWMVARKGCTGAWFHVPWPSSWSGRIAHRQCPSTAVVEVISLTSGTARQSGRQSSHASPCHVCIASTVSTALPSLFIAVPCLQWRVRRCMLGQSGICRLPQVLVLQLRRSTWDMNTGQPVKVRVCLSERCSGQGHTLGCSQLAKSIEVRGRRVGGSNILCLSSTRGYQLCEFEHGAACQGEGGAHRGALYHFHQGAHPRTKN